jgi:hypothetical protein
MIQISVSHKTPGPDVRVRFKLKQMSRPVT